MPSGYRLPWKKSVPEPAEPPMTKPALITLKEMPPPSAYAGDSSVMPMRVSNAIRLERNEDVARIDDPPRMWIRSAPRSRPRYGDDGRLATGMHETNSTCEACVARLAKE